MKKSLMVLAALAAIAFPAIGQELNNLNFSSPLEESRIDEAQKMIGTWGGEPWSRADWGMTIAVEEVYLEGNLVKIRFQATNIKKSFWNGMEVTKSFRRQETVFVDGKGRLFFSWKNSRDKGQSRYVFSFDSKQRKMFGAKDDLGYNRVRTDYMNMPFIPSGSASIGDKG